MNRATRRAMAKRKQPMGPLTDDKIIAAARAAGVPWDESGCESSLGLIRKAGLLPTLMSLNASLVDKYGEPPFDVEIVAAHEVGHLIAGLALGGRFTTCELRPSAIRPGCFDGFTSVFIDGVHGRMIAPDIDRAECAAFLITILGGVCAERYIGRWHGASSIEEVLYANVAATNMEGRDLKAGTRMNDKLFDATEGLIAENEDAFHNLRRILERSHRITASDLGSVHITSRHWSERSSQILAPEGLAHE